MEITQELRTLAKFYAPELPVISLYLDAQWRDEHQRERVHTFLTRQLRQARLYAVTSESARSSLDSDMARIAEWGEQLLRGTTPSPMPGYALFACSGADLWIEFPAPVPFEDEFSIAHVPILRQLARIDDDYTNALIVLVDSRSARVCEVVLGGFLAESTFASEVPGRHKQGGWAQMRYQRHVKDHIDRHHKEVAAYVAAYIAKRPLTALILAGQDEIVANFRTFLPPAVHERILDSIRLDIREAQNRILEVAQDILQHAEQEEEATHLQLLLNRAGHGGLAVVGLQETLAAANTGRIHQLIMHRDVHIAGWRCHNCGTLGEGTLEICGVCQAKVHEVDLGDAVVNAVLQADGFIELIEPEPRLASFDGLGALLRYK
jgi:peptide chain release factor subunit 1